MRPTTLFSQRIPFFLHLAGWIGIAFLVVGQVTYAQPVLLVDNDQDGLEDSLEQNLAEALFPTTIWFHGEEDCVFPQNPPDEPGLVIYRVFPDPRDLDLISIVYDLVYREDCGSPFFGIDNHPGDVEGFAYTLTADANCNLGWKIYALKTTAHSGGPSNVEEQVLNSCQPPLELFVSLSKHATYLTIERCEQYIDPFQTCEAGWAGEFVLVNAGEEAHRLADDLAGYFPPAAGYPADYIWVNPGDGIFCGGLPVDARSDCVGNPGRKLLDSEMAASAGELVAVMEGGSMWGTEVYATDIAFGNIDGDGRMEMGVTRQTTQGARAYLYDDGLGQFALLKTVGRGWEGGSYATAIAFGDVDGDGRDEIGLTRVTESGARVFLFDDGAAGFGLLWSAGTDWLSGESANDIAFGDVDGDSLLEIGVTRQTTTGSRLFIWDDAGHNFALLATFGEDWSSEQYPTSLAIGSIDGDSAAEIALTRYTTAGERVYLWDDAVHNFAILWTMGSDWATESYATHVALGNWDGDDAQEMGISRTSRNDDRLYLLDDAGTAFATLLTTGSDWERNSYPTATAIGNITNDNTADFVLGRYAKANDRLFLFSENGLWTSSGNSWGRGDTVTALAVGDVDGDNRPEIGLARQSDNGMRFQILTFVAPNE